MDIVEHAREILRSGGEAFIDAADFGPSAVMEMAALASQHNGRLRIARAGVLNEIEKRLLREKLPSRVQFQEESRSSWKS